MPTLSNVFTSAWNRLPSFATLAARTRDTFQNAGNCISGKFFFRGRRTDLLPKKSIDLGSRSNDFNSFASSKCSIVDQHYKSIDLTPEGEPKLEYIDEVNPGSIENLLLRSKILNGKVDEFFRIHNSKYSNKYAAKN